MIYFKISSFIEKCNDLTSIDSILGTSNVILALKIGYTDDDLVISTNRDIAYKTENPSIINYKYIPGATKRDEAFIHSLLDDYRISGREWYKISPEIIKLVDTINTLEDIRMLECSIRTYKLTRIDYIKKSRTLNILVPIIASKLGIDLLKGDFEENYKKISKEFMDRDVTSEDDILDFLNILYPNEAESIINQYYDSIELIDDLAREKFLLGYNVLSADHLVWDYISDYIKKNPLNLLEVLSAIEEHQALRLLTQGFC
jgi:hypothetical protein